MAMLLPRRTFVSWSGKSPGEFCWISLDSSASSTAGTTGAVMWYGCHVLDPSDTEAVSCEHSYGCLGAWTGCPCAVSARSSDSDVKGRYAFVLCHLGGGCCGLHCGVGGAL